MVGSELRELFKLLGRPGLISFASGAPDADLFPVEALRGIMDDILCDPARARVALQYGVSEGYGPLRDLIAGKMTADGMRCEVENILIVNGAQQAVEFCSRLFLDPGAGVLVQNPSYLGALQAFRPWAPNYALLDWDGSAEPEAASCAMAYLMPRFHNPTGRHLDLQARMRVVSQARAWRLPVVEDDPYSELWFDGPPGPTLTAIDLDGKSMDEGRTIYCGSFAKTLAPGLRLGWLAAPRPLIERMTLFKQASDMHAGMLDQMAATDLLQGLPPDRMSAVRDRYRGRRDALVAALDRHLPPTIAWSRPEGGFFVLLTLPAGLDAAAIFPSAVEAGVAFAPGGSFHARGGGANTIRLSFSALDPGLFDQGIARLAPVLGAFC
jgi:DNA-binding transcriptional MocR family regulator